MARVEVTDEFKWGFVKGYLQGCGVVIVVAIICFTFSGCATDNEFVIGKDEVIGPLGWYQFCKDNPAQCRPKEVQPVK